MVVVAQSVRASDCGSEGRGFESHLPPTCKINNIVALDNSKATVFLYNSIKYLNNFPIFVVIIYK